LPPGYKADSHRRVYMDVPFADKDVACDLGARWDPRVRKWYDPSADKRLTRSWQQVHVPHEEDEQDNVPLEAHTYIKVPFREKEQAELLAARWGPSLRGTRHWHHAYHACSQ